jgi:alpha-1,3-fucosyltransferase
MLDNDYKFYMAFENSLYEDYVTEKLFDNLKRFIIPVVYGGADYSKFAPPKSYIDVNEFETVDKLVEYLEYLDKHPEEYIKYFWWKKYYRIETSTPFCDLCKSLHEMDKTEQGKVYEDPRGWWFKDEFKRTARIKF